MRWFWSAQTHEETVIERHGRAVSAVQGCMQARIAVVDLADGRPTIARRAISARPGRCASSPATARPNGRRRPISSASSRPQWSTPIPIKADPLPPSSRPGSDTSRQGDGSGRHEHTGAPRNPCQGASVGTPTHPQRCRAESPQLSQGQFDSKYRAVRAVPLVDFDSAVMRLNDRTHDGKTHAHSVIFRGKEWVEDLFCGFLGYARPRVGNRDFGELPVSVVATVTAFSVCFVPDVASNPFRIKFEKTCCN